MNAPQLGSPWSPPQLAWLQAMGHVVYLDAQAVPLPAAALSAVTADAPRAGSPRPPARAPLPPRRAASAPSVSPAVPSRPAAVATAAMAAPRRSSPPALPDRLYLALLRASARAPEDAEVAAVLREFPLADLRADPAAKRALWPRLRALRRAAERAR